MDLTRGLSAPTLAAIQRPFFPLLFGHLDWPDAPVRAHTGVGPITWGGHTWTGVGPLGNVEIPTEAMGSVVATEAILSLIGVPADLDGFADDQIRGRAVSLHLGVVQGRPGGVDGMSTSGPGNVLIGAPVELFSGVMDILDLDASADGTEISHQARVTAITGPGARTRASLTHNDEDQRSKYPTDTAGRHVILAYAKAQKLKWPEN